jgi:hypothetical protein
VAQHEQVDGQVDGELLVGGQRRRGVLIVADLDLWLAPHQADDLQVALWSGHIKGKGRRHARRGNWPKSGDRLALNASRPSFASSEA